MKRSTFTRYILLYAFQLLMGRWLQYHDRDTGDLCGMLPLAVGMKVALTEHLDRPKNLLKGSVGRIHSWVWQDNDRLPSAVYVHFPNAEWKLDGVEMPGVYPILPKQKDWYLDARRDNPVLKIKRRQIPLTPAYAMTAHASQGKTLPAVLLDLNVDKKVDATFGTVAASRVRSREDCLILRPFPHFLFNRGMPEGPGLLLKTLRGEIVDWPAFREGRIPTATCCGCLELLPFDAFDYHQWERVRANDRAKCLSCKKVPGGNGPKRRKIDSGCQKYICDGCKITKVEDAFPRAQLQQDESKAVQKLCLKCCRGRTHHLQCSQCQTTPALQGKFRPNMATMPAAWIACETCQNQAQQKIKRPRKYSRWFECRGCGQMFPTASKSSKTDDKQGRSCLNCQSRCAFTRGEQTCRGCKRKWTEAQPKDGSARKRYCPTCRK